MPAEQDHYFSRQVGTPSEQRPITLRIGDTEHRLLTDRGVFSYGRLDPGTEVLLDKAPPPPAVGDLLDLGCGYGPIAAWMAELAPRARVWAVDVNQRALELARANLAPFPNVTVGEVVPAGIRFAAIYSNPPIRVGKADLHQLLQEWLDRLAPGGTANLVVQRHLGADSLQGWLAEQGWSCARLGSRRGYRVLAVRRPEPADQRGHASAVRR